MYQNGAWPKCEEEDMDEESAADLRSNRELLVDLMRTTGEPRIELFGVWAGDFAEEPAIREEICVDSILRSDFYFKQRGFYRVTL
jgi:hypothetical protein